MASKLIRKVRITPPSVIFAEQRIVQKGELDCNASTKSFFVFEYPSIEDVKWTILQSKGKTDIATVRFSKDRLSNKKSKKKQYFHVEVGFVKMSSSNNENPILRKCTAHWTKRVLRLRVTSKKDAGHPIQLRIPITESDGVYMVFFISNADARIIGKMTAKRHIHLVAIGQPVEMK